jgi:hypothetical protein
LGRGKHLDVVAGHTCRVSDPQPEPKPVMSSRSEPDITQDESDVGWGDEQPDRDDEWYLRERPPHHE